jgi:hypothetical protein
MIDVAPAPTPRQFEIIEDAAMVEIERGIVKPKPYALQDGSTLRMHPETAARYRRVLERHGVKWPRK